MNRYRCKGYRYQDTTPTVRWDTEAESKADALKQFSEHLIRLDLDITRVSVRKLPTKQA